MDNILYTSVEQQIEKLKTQNLVINDEEFAAYNLKLYGYSNLIKSYREPYVIEKDNKKIFRDGISFEQVCSLYLLDKNLRSAVFSAMLDLEEHIKEAAADITASTFGVHQDDYIKFRNYRDRRCRVERFTLSNILQRLRNNLGSGKDPIHHYATEHGIVPPWILFKSIYFSDIINFIKYFKQAEKEKMIECLYGNDINLESDQLIKLMMDTFFISLEYRNLAAHGGRIYNADFSHKLRREEIFNAAIPSNSGFSLLVFLLNLLKYDNPFRILKTTLDDEINRHCKSFPEDVTYLSQILNINIEKHNLVYVNENSKTYHKDPHCSGMRSGTELELSTAVSRGYKACKKCIR